MAKELEKKRRELEEMLIEADHQVSWAVKNLEDAAEHYRTAVNIKERIVTLLDDTRDKLGIS